MKVVFDKDYAKHVSFARPTAQYDPWTCMHPQTFHCSIHP